MSGPRSPSRLGLPGLLARHLLTSPGTSVLVAVLVLLSVLAVALAPRALAMVATEELHHDLGALSPAARDLNAVGLLQLSGLPSGARPDADQLYGETDTAIASLDHAQDEPLRSVLGEPDWFAVAPPTEVIFPDDARPTLVPVIGMVSDLDWTSRIRVIDGALPRSWAGDDNDETPSAERPPIEIAISADVAELIEASVGDVLPFEPAPLTVTAIYEPADSDAPYWSHAPLLRSGVIDASGFGPPRAVFSAYVDPESTGGLFNTFSAARIQAWIPLEGDRMDYLDAPRIEEQIRRLEGFGPTLSNGVQLRIDSGSTATIEGVIDRVTTVTALIALAASGPLGVLLGVFALGARSVLERRRPAIALTAARGASALQTRGSALIEGLILAVPATALGIVLAPVLLPAAVEPTTVILPIVIGLTVPVMLAVGASSRGFRTTRADAVSPRATRIRLVVEIALVGLAVLALFLLARRGLAATAAVVGIDPLLAATPLLLAIAVCILVLRLYPLPLSAVLARMRARRGATGLVGAARAVRSPTLGFPAALAIIVGISIGVFAGVLGTTVDTAMLAAARADVGADIRVEAEKLDDDVAADIAGVSGVATVTGLDVENGQVMGTTLGDVDVTAIFADTDALRGIMPELPPDLSEFDGGRIPVVASEALAAQYTGIGRSIGEVPALLAGTLPSAALPGVSVNWVLIDRAFQDQLTDNPFSAQRLLVAVDADADVQQVASAIRPIVVDAQREVMQDAIAVVDTTTVLTEAQALPTIAGLRAALLIAIVLAFALSVLTVVLGSITASSARAQLVGVLRTLGMSPRQTAGLIAWELAPVAITAVLAGTVLGLVLPWIVTAAVDLRPFVGGDQRPSPTVDPLLVIVTVLGFVVVVALAGAIAVWIGRRRNPVLALKMGAE